ncbi:MAG: hypothetical protein QM808_16080 [Steroidobacteraceae bacterium]
MIQVPWLQWQQQVLRKIRRDYSDILQHLSLDDIDWAVWRSLYDQGRSAKDAVNYAFVRESTYERRPKTK